MTEPSEDYPVGSEEILGLTGINSWEKLKDLIDKQWFPEPMIHKGRWFWSAKQLWSWEQDMEYLSGNMRH